MSAAKPAVKSSGPLSEVSAFPNPFDSRTRHTTIRYRLSEDSRVRIIVYNVYGRLVREWTFYAGLPGGRRGVNLMAWDGTDRIGRKVSKGIYPAVIWTGKGRTVMKIGVRH